MSLKSPIYQLTAGCYSCLHHITAINMHLFRVIKRLDYCNSFLAGCIKQQLYSESCNKYRTVNHLLYTEATVKNHVIPRSSTVAEKPHYTISLRINVKSSKKFTCHFRNAHNVFTHFLFITFPRTEALGTY